jgi:hypothetical protein
MALTSVTSPPLLAMNSTKQTWACLDIVNKTHAPSP